MATDKVVSEIEPTKKFYKEARAYWSNVEPTVDGMLGGFEYVSKDDVKESQEFLDSLFKVSLSYSN